MWRRLGGKVTLKPPERKENVINVSTRLLGDLARARYGLDEVVWVYELPAAATDDSSPHLTERKAAVCNERKDLPSSAVGPFVTI